MTEGKLKIRQQLQRSFSVLKKCLQTWKESQNETASAKDKIGNFTEQYQCCAKVDAGSLDICRQFPDLQERLLFKIECEANEIFAELQNHMWVDLYYILKVLIISLGLLLLHIYVLQNQKY